MARLFADENFPLPVVEALRQLGHDVQTIHNSGMVELAVSDRDVLKVASGSNRAVLTLNRRHFVLLHQQDSDHAGIVVCTADSDFVGQATRIHAAITGLPTMVRSLVRVNRAPT